MATAAACPPCKLNYLSVRLRGCKKGYAAGKTVYGYDVRGTLALTDEELNEVLKTPGDHKPGYKKKPLATFAVAAFGISLCGSRCDCCADDGLEDDRSADGDGPPESADECLPLCAKVSDVGNAFPGQATRAADIRRPVKDIVRMIRAEQRVRKSEAVGRIKVSGLEDAADGGDILRARLRVVEKAEGQLRAARELLATKSAQRSDIRANLATILAARRV
jgi:hypothetical protein